MEHKVRSVRELHRECIIEGSSTGKNEDGGKAVSLVI
jgi:hypothetical protein